ncbi:MAG: CHASE domain-containing protein, partial [Pseudomonas sp.]|nr:CHASE domain-containing protein [Pseudomonas sp.]
SIAAPSLAQISLQGLPVALSIAVGSSLQCLLASWLIRRWVGFPNPLSSERSIFLLLLIGGPLTCMLSASVGSFTLLHHQLISAAQLPFSWWTWWVGDSIGVLIATPLMFILFAQPRELWRSRAGSVGLPLLISCAIMVLIFLRASQSEQNTQNLRFHQQAKLISATLQARMALYDSALQSMERFFVSSRNVSHDEFASFVANLPQAYPGIHALSWNARITATERPEFERNLHSQGLIGVHIFERNSSGAPQAAASREEYVPITYIEPRSSNRTAIGYNVDANPIRHQALSRARDQAQSAMTAPINLMQDQQQAIAVLLFHPVYRSPLPPSSLAERRRLLRGYVVAVIRIADMLDDALSAYPRDDFQLQLSDISEPSPALLYGLRETPATTAAKPMIWEQELSYAGRQLRLRISPSPAYLQAQHSLQPWSVLAGGLLLCSLIGAFLLTMTGRAEHVRQQVRQQTLELSAIFDNAVDAILLFNPLGQIEHANPAAQQLFGYGLQLQNLSIAQLLPRLNNPAALQASLGQGLETIGRQISARKKVERLKSEFVSTVSHELRTPLTSIKGSLSLLSAGVLGPLPESASAMLTIAQENTERLIQLVNDILDIEKLELGQAGLHLERERLLPQLEQALAHNQGYADNFAVQLRLDTSALPASTAVHIDSLRLQQVLSNLISNAVKFSPAQGLVSIRAGLDGQQVRVEVSDQGAGISEEFRARIFQKFAQADGSNTRQHGGTGLGLSICKTLVERMHGRS